MRIKTFSNSSGSVWMLLALLATGCATFTPSPRSIESLETIALGGVKQHILLRGENRTNPILLFLHGGPGIPELPISQINAGLEKDFLVVQWDQRGTGKTFDPLLPDSELTVSKLVQDTLQLTQYLRERFGTRKVVLVGFSFGSLIGALAVEAKPEFFAAFVGVSQFVNLTESERLLDYEGRMRAAARGDFKTVETMERIGPPPYTNWKDGTTINVVTRKLVGPIRNELTPIRYAAHALVSPYYDIADYFRLVEGMKFAWDVLNKEMYEINLMKEAPVLKVPVYCLLGRHDTILSTTLAVRYFEKLRAPAGKHLIWFENSGHAPHVEEREKYQEVLRAIRKDL